MDLSCHEHPKYAAKRAPRGDCRLCCRMWAFKDQREQRGWDGSDTWSLDQTVAQFIAPRLRRFQELTIGVPHVIEDPETGKMDVEASYSAWHGILHVMVETFEFLASDEKYDASHDDPRWKLVEEGLTLFADNFGALWW